MKIAILLLVHKNAEQIKRLLSALRHEHVDIFIHIDKKCAISPSDIAAPNVFFTSNRYDVGLFEFSMVEAERELIRTAQQHGEYGYYLLMSGQCYPLVSMDQLYTLLSQRYPEPFIEIVAPTKENYVTRNFAHVTAMKWLKIRSYGFLKQHVSYRMYRILRYIPGGIALVGSHIKEMFVKSPKDRLDRMNIFMYCGSQWWILPDKVIDRVLPYFDNKAFCAVVNDCFSCDETFFQTAIMAQQKENGIQLDAQGNFMNGKWFFIFDDGHPIVLTRENYPQIVDSKMLFARKFEINVDSQVLDLIDAQRNTQNTER